MSTTETDVRPEVAAFVAQVRARLADLTEEEREELTGGLEADLSEQHAVGDALPDPAAYAEELRAAAGLPPARRSLRRLQVSTDLDTCRRQFFALVENDRVFTRRGWEVVEATRPAWWVLRAWIAVTLLDQLVGPWEYVGLWPTLGVPLLGPVLLVAAVVVSVLIGQGRLWPGSGADRPVVARVVLIALNLFAVLVPFTFTGDGSGVADHGYVRSEPVPKAENVLRHGREVVRNIYAYDASGQPLTGVQLFDQDGRAVAVAPQSSLGRRPGERQVTCPWFNGATPLFNVFPLQQRSQPFGTCLRDHPDAGAAAYAQAPLASVPPVSVTAR